MGQSYYRDPGDLDLAIFLGPNGVMIVSWILRSLKVLLLLLVVFLTGPILALALGKAEFKGNWRTASREVVGIAPDPAQFREAIVQVYAARAFGWRGAFAVHTWIAVKPQDAESFSSYEVVGWNYFRGRTPLVQRQGPPDRRWFGAEPEIIFSLRGDKAARLIPKLEQAVAGYPYRNYYRTWPGPNSNSFTAHVLRQVPELEADLPPTAVGKDYLAPGHLIQASISGTGYQLSLFGLAGGVLAWEEGIEFNLLGLSLGLDPLDLALKLPGLGRLSFADTPAE